MQIKTDVESLDSAYETFTGYEMYLYRRFMVYKSRYEAILLILKKRQKDEIVH